MLTNKRIAEICEQCTDPRTGVTCEYKFARAVWAEAEHAAWLAAQETNTALTAIYFIVRDERDALRAQLAAEREHICTDILARLKNRAIAGALLMSDVREAFAAYQAQGEQHGDKEG